MTTSSGSERGHRGEALARPGALDPAAERKLRWRVPLVSALHGAITASYRTRFLNRPYAERRREGERVRCIYAAWHETLWHGIAPLRGQGVCTMVSTHRDGELIARVLARKGFTLARGSSTRGGAAALREMVRSARQADADLCITIDGPKGPRREVKEGVLMAASLTGLPIVPLTAVASPAWRLGSWDRMLLGKPFARVVYHFGEEIQVPRRVEREELIATHRPRVEAAMARSEEEALAALGG